MKKLIAAFVVLSLVTVLVAACGGSSDNGSATVVPTTGSQTGTVHMDTDTFLQNSVTINKGSSLNLVDDVASTHIIENGSWMGNTPKPATEPGAPKVSNVMFSTARQSQMVGPFNTAGTYHLFCIVHPGMNLTVTVQ